jgi:hypothetical protein
MFIPSAKTYVLSRLYSQLMEKSTDVMDPIVYPQFLALSSLEIDQAAHRIAGMRRNYQHTQIEAEQTEQSLMQLLARFHVIGSTKKTLDRDSIFALLGIASDADTLSIIPDYDLSKPDSVIFTAAARAMITSGHVDLLSFSRYWETNDDPPRKTKGDVPSWVPD